MTDGSIPKHPVNRPNAGNSELPGGTERTEKDILIREGIPKGYGYPLSVPLLSAAKFAISLTAGMAPWQRGLFKFARMIHTAAGGLKADFTRGAPIWSAVEDWYRAAKPPVGLPEVESEFAICYPKVRFPTGRDRWNLIVDAAIDKLAENGQQIFPGDASTELLLALCWVLSCESEDGEFFISVREATEACGFSGRMTAWRRLQLLQAQGFIRETKPGTKRLAARYRFVGYY